MLLEVFMDDGYVDELINLLEQHEYHNLTDDQIEAVDYGIYAINELGGGYNQ